MIFLVITQFSIVQTYLADKVLGYLSKEIDYDLSLSKVRVAWLDRGELSNFLIKDLHNDTMFYADQLVINYNLVSLMRGDYLSLQEILLHDVQFNLTRHDSEEELNVKYFLESLGGESEKRKLKTLKIGHLEISGCNVRLDDKAKPDIKKRVDFSNLDFFIPNLNLFDFEIRSDTIIGDLNHFTGKDNISGLEIKQFETVFEFSNRSLSLDELNLKTNTSHIADSLVLFYNGLDDFGHFAERVSFIFHFREALISTHDLELITGLSQVKSAITLDGIFEGKVGDFKIENSRVGFGSSTFLKGSVSCFGLPAIDKTFIIADITSSSLLPSDLAPYVGDVSENLKRMGKIDFKGNFTGFLTDFAARGDFYTDQGSVHSDIHIKMPESPENMLYDGNIELINLNAGAFFESQAVERINLKGTIKGKGINLKTADFKVDAEVFSSKLVGYEYDSIHINGSFAENFFSGKIAVNDPNCKLEGEARIDLRSDRENLKLNLLLDSVSFDQLNLTSTPFGAQGKIDLTVNDFDIDIFQANLEADSLLIKHDDKTVLFNDIHFDASYDKGGVRKINYNMPGLSAKVEGQFKISDLTKDAQVMTDSYLSKLQLKSDTINRVGNGEKYKLAIDIEIQDISPYLDSLKFPLKIYNHAKLEASYRQSKGSYLSLFFETDSLKFKNIKLREPFLEINGSLNGTSQEILTSFMLTSESQTIEDLLETENFFLEGIWSQNVIDLTTSIEQPAFKTDLRLETEINLFSDSIVMRLKPSEVHILANNWEFNPSNRVVVKNGDFTIKNLDIFGDEEFIQIEKTFSASSETFISILVEDLKIDKMNLFTQHTIDGYLNGSFNFSGKNPNDLYAFNSDFFLESLTYDALLLGDLTGKSSWNPVDLSIFSEINMSREGFKSIDIKGNYYPSKSEDQLAFTAKFDDAQLALVRPFLEPNLSDISGTVDGEIKIKGNLKSPKTDGNLIVKDGRARINYLNTVYAVSGAMDLHTDRIDLQSITLKDRKGNNAVATGSLNHEGFKNIVTDVDIQAGSFEFLNTTSLDNELYYGSVYGSGQIAINGPVNDLNIEADVKTAAGTRFFIPVSESTEGSQKEFIEFVSFLDSSYTNSVEDRFEFKGLTLDFDIEVTPDAYCELIFDIKKGDIIRGRGRGNLKLTLNTDEEFSMFGGLEITDGAYNFTVPNFINKEFEMVPGGRITWRGDVYDASLDLDATYLQRASPEELKNPDERTEGTSIKVPFLAILELEGNMNAPNLNFNIQPQNEGDLQQDAEGRRLLNQVINDEQELRKQFVSLLFLKKFSPIASFFGGSNTNDIRGSVSEILSNQASYLLSQFDDNLELELEMNLADQNQDLSNTFQFRLAYTFLDSRLRVSNGGAFGNNNAQNQRAINQIVGDWSVEYSLTKDSRLRLKAFRNSNELFTSEQQNFETGASLKFVDSFDGVKDLFRIRREAIIRRKEDETATNPEINDAEPPRLEK
ncbi:MAG: translocation/assembly module TamB domain-containing protein [Ekhidna sp.]|nr:translocation/assembly module TamB domain-containing protein [Ekhidna sp.]